MNSAAQRLRQESCALEPTLQLPTCAEHLLRLLQIGEQVLEACELQLDDVPIGVDPFNYVAEILQVAVDEGDLPSVRRLTIALEFAPLADEACHEQDMDALARLVARAESCLQRMAAGHLEVVRG